MGMAHHYINRSFWHSWRAICLGEARECFVARHTKQLRRTSCEVINSAEKNGTEWLSMCSYLWPKTTESKV